MSGERDSVAEAIRCADMPATAKRHPWSSISGNEKDHYRHLAQAALDACDCRAAAVVREVNP